MSEDEYNRLLKQFPEKLQGAIKWKTYFERLVQAGRRTGRTDLAIGDDIRTELKGQLDDRTMRLYLPSSMKHQEMIRQSSNDNKFAAKLPQKEPELPPPAQVVREAETQTESFIPHSEINTDPILDCRKFDTELRMGLMNNRKLRLKINRLNEVVEIL